MRLSRVNERRSNGRNPATLILVAVIAVILLAIVAYFIFGNNSGESDLAAAPESDNNQISDSGAAGPLVPTVPTPVETPLVPTKSPTEVPTPVRTPVPTVVPTSTPTPLPTLPPTPIPTLDIAKSPLPEVVNDNPPHIYAGTVTIDGQPAPDGTEVTAWMLKYSEPLGTSIVPALPEQPGSYSLLIPQYGTELYGTAIIIKVDGLFVTNSVWISGHAEILDLEP